MEKKEKVVPPSPPRVIRDETTGNAYKRVGFLGEGGFARVWEVQTIHGERKAVKVVNKDSIKSKKNKTKLWAEIKLHQMLSHPNIVKFEDCFEDDENVYMMLELCENGSLMDLLRKRKRYTEPEARVILVQLIAACQYMHQTNVIHRDLKLGNLFLDDQMNVKVGDFGLAALIEKPGDRKKTICGTPNYIAPEVLFDTVNGHSFEVDVWSMGVILYTLLIGKPPFQTKDVKAIYKRIKENRYEFPADKEISPSAQELIMIILNPEPDKRPSLDAILHHSWFSDGPFPPFVPVTAHDSAPDFRRLTHTESRRNMQAVYYKAKIGATSEINAETGRLRSNLGPSIIQQERDFKYAVQPGSPVGALIKSARQPLVQGPSEIKDTALLRKLSAAGAQSTLSPVRRGHAAISTRAAMAAGPSSGRRQMAPVGEEAEDEDQEMLEEPLPPTRYDTAVRERELASQKMRIVSEMASNDVRMDEPMSRPSPRKQPLGPATTIPSTRSSTAPMEHRSSGKQRMMEAPSRRPEAPGLFETVGVLLADAFAASDTMEGYRAPDLRDCKPPQVFVVSWLDYCTKYGMGWAMSDGTVGVHFNDSTSLALSPSKTHADHVYPEDGGHSRRNYFADSAPPELSNKFALLYRFQGYMAGRLVGQLPYTYEDGEMTKGMTIVTRYLRMKHVIVFRLSNQVVQFNFYDHTKLILSEGGLVVSFIDKSYNLWCWSLEDLLWMKREEEREQMDSKEKKRADGVLYKLHYAMDVLIKVHAHMGSGGSRKSSKPAVQAQENERPVRVAERPIR